MRRRDRGGAGPDSIRSRLTAECLGLERDGDEVYLVMEYIPGRNLADAVKERPLARARRRA